MKKVKIIFGLVVIGFIGLFFYQNREFFMDKPRLSLELPFVNIYHLPEWPNAVLFVAFLLFGLLVSYFSNLFERYKANRTVKSLNAAVNSHLEAISTLQGEVAALKGGDSTDGKEPEESPEGTGQ